MYGKAYHLPFKLDHKALWEPTRSNFEWSDVAKLKHEVEQSTFYKEKMKLYNDCKIKKHESTTSDMVLLFDSKLKLFPVKQK